MSKKYEHKIDTLKGHEHNQGGYLHYGKKKKKSKPKAKTVSQKKKELKEYQKQVDKSNKIW
ncbi:MAG: hypothetical protein JW891_09170 [Candidatus Lokiarchaeota archaeon]|nr:hypothetical protein [Candidatus Lokiarchaeota archaeon]